MAIKCCLLLLLRGEKYYLNCSGIGSFFAIRPVMGSYSQAKYLQKYRIENSIIYRFEMVELIVEKMRAQVSEIFILVSRQRSTDRRYSRLLDLPDAFERDSFDRRKTVIHNL